MKHNRVLNRPMFNPNNSAYGRGITTNLVTEQERQKFNTGGRVRYEDGDSVGEKISTIPVAKGVGAVSDWVNQQLYNVGTAGYNLMGVPLNTLGRTFGYNPGFSGERFFQPLADKLGVETRFTGEKPEDIDTAQLFFGDTYAPAGGAWSWEPKETKIKQVNTEGEPESEFKKQLIHKPEVIDEESDVIDWTPEEKQEKKGQIQLAMAERLIGGARDPLGSTKQQKNLAGMFGDIRKITDKEDLRKWKRRYDAEADAYMKKMGSVNKMGREYSDYRHQGLQPTEALNRMSDVSAKTITRVTKQKDLDKQYKGLGPGSVVYDENDGGWYIINPKGGRENVTIEDIIEADKKGVLKEWKETKITLKS